MVNLLYFIGCYMKYLFGLVFITLFGIVCFSFGKQSVKLIVPKCQETKLTLVASQVNDKEVVCVYVEPWQIKGKTKRIENVI